MREFMDFEQKLQKTYYNRNVYGLGYTCEEEVLVFKLTVNKGETRKITSFFRGPYRIIEIIDDLNFKALSYTMTD